jgi:hypothetical protein
MFSSLFIFPRPPADKLIIPLVPFRFFTTIQENFFANSRCTGDIVDARRKLTTGGKFTASVNDTGNNSDTGSKFATSANVVDGKFCNKNASCNC